MKLFALLSILLFSSTLTLAQNEQAPILEKEFKYNDWTYNSIRDDSPINLRTFTSGKKLVIVVYFAPWCDNWRHDAPLVSKLYEKYHSSGLDIIGVAEYGTKDAVIADLATKKISFPVVGESSSRDDRLTTLHYDYRKETGDTRKWGSPWYVFIDPAKTKKKGERLLKKTFVVNGELIEAEIDKFIRERLGLPAERLSLSQKKDAIEVCETDEKPPALKKP